MELSDYSPDLIAYIRAELEKALLDKMTCKECGFMTMVEDPEDETKMFCVLCGHREDF